MNLRQYEIKMSNTGISSNQINNKRIVPVTETSHFTKN